MSPPMGKAQQKVLFGGLLLICLVSLAWTEGYSERRVIDLTELVALGGAWTCIVLLWGSQVTAKLHEYVTGRRERNRAKLIAKISALISPMRITDKMLSRRVKVVDWRAMDFQSMKQLFLMVGQFSIIAEHQRSETVDFAKRHCISQGDLNRLAQIGYPEYSVSAWDELPFFEYEGLRSAALRIVSEERLREQVAKGLIRKPGTMV